MDDGGSGSLWPQNVKNDLRSEDLLVRLIPAHLFNAARCAKSDIAIFD